MARERTILHADMDAFFASVEQRERPELRGKPVIVGAGSARGVVAAASYEARQFGVRSAMPGFRARQLCPHAVFVPGRMDLYAAVSRVVRDVFYEFTSDVEPLALDEAFLDITGSIHLWGSAHELARQLKARVQAQTSLCVSVGVGPNKLAAKLACTASKPDGLLVLAPDEVRSWMAPLPIRRLWGVGPVTAERLMAAGFERIGQMADEELPRLVSVLGRRAAEFQARAQGIDDSNVACDREAKSVGEENTFEVDIVRRDQASAALTAHAESVAQRLRAAGLRGRTVTVKIKLGTKRGERQGRNRGDTDPIYPVISRSRTLASDVDDASEIRRVALELWDTAGVTEAVRLLGVSVSNVTAEARVEQLGLFDRRERPEVGKTMDAIVERFGKNAIRRAVDDPIKITPNLHKRPTK
jgi:DNA polymerase IV